MPRVMFIPALLILATVVGCSNEQRSKDVNAALADYAAGNYQSAYDKASMLQVGAFGDDRAKAAYVAGICAFKLNRLADADSNLLIASGAEDKQIVGKAKATLGHVRMKQNRPQEAAAYFKEAAALLSGEESAKASYEAGVAYKAAGEMSTARSQLSIASNAPSAPAGVRADAREQLADTGFALQIGVFTDRANAQRAQREAQALATKHRLGEVRLVAAKDQRGRAVTIVQLGSFGSRQAAEQARRTIGKLEYVVKPIVR